MWNPFTTNANLGRARQVANEHRVRAMELEQALEGLVTTVDALPITISYRPSTQAKGLIQGGHTVAIRVPALADPGAPVAQAVRYAKEVLG